MASLPAACVGAGTQSNTARAERLSCPPFSARQRPTPQIPRMHIRNLLVPALFTTSLAAQASVVTPVQYASVAGPSSYTGAWHFTDRSQQIHADLRNQNLVLKSIAWRRSAYPATDPNSVSRTIDAEFFAGEGDMNAAGVNFLANYQSPRVNVVTRKSISLPDWTLYQGAPAQFTFVVPFDQPYTYSGTNDLVWEVIVWANSGNSNYLTDACAGILSLPGTVQYVGTGCVATGRSLPVVETVSVESMLGPDRLVLTALCGNLPGTTPAALMVGASDPDQTVPGLCAKVHSDALVFVQGTSTALGGYSVGPLTFSHVPALVGQKLWLQFLATDMGQSFPVVVSNGASVEIPNLPPPLPLVKLVRAAQQPTSAVGLVYSYLGQIVRFGL